MKNRSQFIEEAIIAHLERRKKMLRNKQDIDLIDKNYKALNAEASDVLSYQAKVWLESKKASNITVAYIVMN